MNDPRFSGELDMAHSSLSSEFGDCETGKQTFYQRALEVEKKRKELRGWYGRLKPDSWLMAVGYCLAMIPFVSWAVAAYWHNMPGKRSYSLMSYPILTYLVLASAFLSFLIPFMSGIGRVLNNDFASPLGIFAGYFIFIVVAHCWELQERVEGLESLLKRIRSKQMDA